MEYGEMTKCNNHAQKTEHTKIKCFAILWQLMVCQEAQMRYGEVVRIVHILYQKQLTHN